MTRRPENGPVDSLRSEGIEVAIADMDDRASRDRVIRGADGVFSVQNFYETGPEREVEQGRNMAAAAAAAGVDHFVYASVAGSTLGTGIPQFESKGRVERYIEQLKLPATILQPIFFMDNLVQFFPPTTDEHGGLTVSMGLDPATRVPMIATEDVGAVTAAVFADRDVWLGHSLELAGDVVTPNDIVATVERVTQRPTTYVQVPSDEMRAIDQSLAELYDWLNASPYRTDPDHTRALDPMVMDLESYLRSVGWDENTVFDEPAWG